MKVELIIFHTVIAIIIAILLSVLIYAPKMYPHKGKEKNTRANNIRLIITLFLVFISISGIALMY